ncbi:ovochymase-2-like [Wyeomyia smithii]|uniref:ovochymase-2-like n=1 Tax=Wyeomyia smithii TaxID=174621 RepID=UPI00246806F0|nr:ovochymase-2-like [Wyeomyia smithii]
MIPKKLLVLLWCVVKSSSNHVPIERLFGGVRVEPGELPFTVQILLESITFSGSILTDRLILTAAHSVCGHTFQPEAFEVIAGQYDLLVWESSRQSRSVQEVFAHPDYRSLVIGLHDVALLLLAAPFEFTNFVQPVAVDYSDAYPSTVAMLAGYGTILLNGEQAKFLMVKLFLII